MLFKKLISWGDKLEDHIRGRLSRYPIFYALIGGTAIVLFWRGVWHSNDWLNSYLEVPAYLDGPLSIVFGIIILLTTGLIVSSFIGERIIISGLRGEKNVTAKALEEVEEEEIVLKQIKTKVDKIEKELEELTGQSL